MSAYSGKKESIRFGESVSLSLPYNSAYCSLVLSRKGRVALDLFFCQSVSFLCRFCVFVDLGRIFFCRTIDFLRGIGYTVLGDIDFLSVSLVWFGALETVKSVCGISYFFVILALLSVSAFFFSETIVTAVTLFRCCFRFYLS